MLKDKIKDIFDNFRLGKEQEEYDIVHSEIEKATIFRGTNLIILICAILVASVGLNMNSTAVIIGAMLISPLMGPINGMGYSIATYDFELFKSAIRNYLFAVVVSLLTSALYFLISPVSTAHSELLARTNPTIYDVLIAVFGGIAGMLAINSKLKGNVIPGVAIATALMPPICTAGYGLATLHFEFFFGALYLFTINTVFIAVAAMIVAQMLKFPIRTIVDPDKMARVNRIISFTLVVVTVPSVIFGYRLVKNEQFFENANRFVKEVSIKKSTFLLESNINSQNHSLLLIYSGYGVNDKEKQEILETALRYEIDTANIEIVNGTDVAILEKEKEDMQSQKNVLNNEINAKNNEINAMTFLLQQEQKKIDSIVKIPTYGKVILSEIKTLYPQITSCSYAESYVYPDTILRPVVVFQTKKRLYRRDKAKIRKWVQERIKKENVQIYFNLY